MNQPRINIRWYVVTDIITCILTWLAFYYLRTVIYNYHINIPSHFYLGFILYTIGWLCLHFLSGSYNSPYQKSRLSETIKTIIVIFIGCMALLFFFILKNPQTNNQYYYLEFYSLLFPNLILTLTSRILFLSYAKKQLQRKTVYFKSLIIGTGQKAIAFYQEFIQSKEHAGFLFTGFIHLDNEHDIILSDSIKNYSKCMCSNLS